MIEEKRRGWTSLLLEAAGLLKGEARRRIRIETLPPPQKKTIDPATDGDETVDRSKGAGAAKGAAKGRGKGGWTAALDRPSRIDVSYRGCPRSFCLRALGQERISAAVISR